MLLTIASLFWLAGFIFLLRGWHAIAAPSFLWCIGLLFAHFFFPHYPL